jgi:hypothetical protein
MPLDLGGGEVRPFIRYKASLNCWEMSSAEGGVTEFEWNAPAVFDVEHIQLGWLHLAEGAREWHAWPNNKQTPKPDEKEWKPGFVVQVYSKALFGSDPVREYSSSATGNVEFIKKLYNQAEAEFGKGVVPVVKITGAKAERIGKGNTRIPLFNIEKYAPRPAELAVEGAPAQAQSAPPKAAAAASAPAESDEF